jgi:hypothetical protein
MLLAGSDYDRSQLFAIDPKPGIDPSFLAIDPSFLWVDPMAFLSSYNFP